MANEKRLIDANALREAVITDYYEHFTRCHDTDQIALIDMVCDDIDEAPTVDAVEVVHGYNTGKARWFQCSECGYGFNDIFLLDESEEMLEPKYCAYCGAKMDGGKSSDI